MKYIIAYTVCLCCVVSALLPSCKKGITDFLDKPPGVDVTEDTIFSSKRQIETFVTGMYRDGLPSMFAIHNINDNGWFQLSAGASDEGEISGKTNLIDVWNIAGINSNNIKYYDYCYDLRWKGIREANIILERVAAGKAMADADYLKQITGEAKFIRAYNYFEMLKRYGGEPIVDKALTAEDVLSKPLKRRSIADMVDFIVKDCDDAAADLPDTYPSNMTGRATKGAALMLKSRVLLFAASPLFNTATPYLDFGANNDLICYGNYDKSRWQKAADAAEAVIDWAPSGGVHLITDQGVDENYEYMWEVPDNPEIILANKVVGPINEWNNLWYGLLPKTVYYGYGGPTVTFDFQKLYEKKDGTPQDWNMNGGDDLNEKYAALDPRFGETIAYNGSYWNSEYPRINTYQGGSQALECLGGAWQRKFVPRSLNSSWSNKVMPNNILMRLAEAYLNYAEALNEAQGPVPAAYDAVDIIRKRSGMPDLPGGLSQEQFRQRVRKERAIELAFEGHRYWDLRRWLIAQQVIGGSMWGLKIYQITGSDDFRYEPYVFETRVFPSRMYLCPFDQTEINKGYLVQNPGW